MQQTTKVLSVAVLMFAMVGVTGITAQLAYADNGIPQELRKNKAYNLNIIGMPKGDKDFSNDEQNNGKRIFVKLVGNTKIGLVEGPFQVNDFDGVDGYAEFQLPKPNLACTEFQTDEELNAGITTSTECEPNDPSYFVFARALGAPNGAKMVFNTCASEYEKDDGTFVDINGNGVIDEEPVCSTEILEAGALDNGDRKGGAKFTNVTKELLTVCVDVYDETLNDEGEEIGFDEECDIRADIFDDRLKKYLWDVEDNGRKLVQLVFVQAPHV